jgi:hypothetical protein
VTTPIGKAVEFTYNGCSTAPTNAGDYAISAIVDDAMYQGSAAGTLTVAKASQTISFTTIGNQTVLDTVRLTAKAASGLEVSFSTSAPGLISKRHFSHSITTKQQL